MVFFSLRVPHFFILNQSLNCIFPHLSVLVNPGNGDLLCVCTGGGLVWHGVVRWTGRGKLAKGELREKEKRYQKRLTSNKDATNKHKTPAQKKKVNALVPPTLSPYASIGRFLFSRKGERGGGVIDGRGKVIGSTKKLRSRGKTEGRRMRWKKKCSVSTWVELDNNINQNGLLFFSRHYVYPETGD